MEPTDDYIIHFPLQGSKKRVRDLITYYEERILPKRESQLDLPLEQTMTTRKSSPSLISEIQEEDYMKAPEPKILKSHEHESTFISKKSKHKKSKSSTSANSRRMFVIHEILSTEKTYVDNLATIQKVFIGPLKGILNVNDIQKLFSNITIIHKFNETLLNQLETRMHGFNCKKTVIGDIFINIIPFLGVYCDYCCNYESAIQFSNLLRQSNPQYASFLQTTYESCKGYGLADLLIMPVQRIPRYKLLLDKLITLTSELHPDYELLNKAYELVSDKATDINKKMNIVTQQKVMMQLHTRFLQSYQLPGGIVQPWRYHICQFEAMWIKPNSCTASKIEFFIFNDIFIISTSPNMPEEKFECITAQPLWNSFILKPYEDWDFYKSYTNTFQVVNPTGAWILSFAHGDYLKVKNQFESARKEFLEQAQEKKVRRMDIKLLPLHEKQEYVAIEPLKGPLPPPIVPKDILQRNPSFEDIQDEDKGDGEVRTPKRSKLSKLRQELHSKTISPKKIIRKGHALTLKAPLTSKKLEQWNQSFNSENMDNSKFTPTKYQTLKSGSTNSSPIVPKKKRTKSTKMTPLKIRD